MSRHIPNKLKLRLIKESLGKCANPGCCADLLDIHHIKFYSATGKHVFEDLICLCPTCHGQVHRGDVRIDKQTLYNWKKILKVDNEIKTGNKTMHFEPSIVVDVKCGNLLIRCTKDLNILKLDHKQIIKVYWLDDDLFGAKIEIVNIRGEIICKVVNNVVKYKKEHVDIEYRSGKIKITTNFPEDFLYLGQIFKIYSCLPNYLSSKNITLLEIEVISEGKIRINGLFIKDELFSIFTDKTIAFFSDEKTLFIEGQSEKTIINCLSENMTLFDIRKKLYWHVG